MGLVVVLAECTKLETCTSVGGLLQNRSVLRERKKEEGGGSRLLPLFVTWYYVVTPRPLSEVQPECNTGFTFTSEVDIGHLIFRGKIV